MSCAVRLHRVATCRESDNARANRSTMRRRAVTHAIPRPLLLALLPFKCPPSPETSKSTPPALQDLQKPDNSTSLTLSIGTGHHLQLLHIYCPGYENYACSLSQRASIWEDPDGKTRTACEH